MRLREGKTKADICPKRKILPASPGLQRVHFVTATSTIAAHDNSSTAASVSTPGGGKEDWIWNKEFIIHKRTLSMEKHTEFLDEIYGVCFSPFDVLFRMISR